MAGINNFVTLHMTKQSPSQAPSSTNPFKVQEPNTGAVIEPRTRNFFMRNVFLIHLILIAILIIFISIRGLTSAHKHHVQPIKFYPPLLLPVAIASVSSLTSHSLICLTPSKTVRYTFWLGPLLTCSLGILLIAIGSGPSLALAVVFIVSAVIQSLYSCWACPRFDHTVRLLSISLRSPPKKTTTIVFLTIIASTIYSGFVMVGIGGASVTKTIFDSLSIFITLLSLTWTMHIIKNTLQVSFARVKYFHFACNTDSDTVIVLRDTVKHCIGSVCVGSVLVPILDIVRGSARSISLLSEGKDEFMFSCADCYWGVASKVITYGNRWGFVYIGVYNKGFVQASSDTWQMFSQIGLEAVVDSDLTSSFCFFSGVAVGSLCALVGGLWALVLHRNDTTELCIYAFLIGYFMCRISTTWPQASVCAYHVAYAENPQSSLFDSTIPDRVRELQTYQNQKNTQKTHLTEF